MPMKRIDADFLENILINPRRSAAPASARVLFLFDPILNVGFF